MNRFDAKAVVMKVVCTRNSKTLAQFIAEKMEIPLIIPDVRRFNNGEICVSLQEQVECAIIVTQTKTDSDWIELFLLLDAIKNAKDITLCMTYMGYSRQDRQNPNESAAAKLFATLLETMNINRCVIIDNHSESFFRVPTWHISVCSLFEKDIANKYLTSRIILVSPDFGGSRRVYNMSKSLKCKFITCNKSKAILDESEKSELANSVKNKFCIVIDDMIDSGATICHTTEILTKAGAQGIAAYCAHGVLSNGAVERIASSAISEIVLTDTIQQDIALPSKIRKISAASLIVDAIRCIVPSGYYS